MIWELIREQFGVPLSEVSVGRLLRKLGFSPQKPLFRAYHQNPEAVQRWLQEEYPAIKRQAELQGALIYFVTRPPCARTFTAAQLAAGGPDADSEGDPVSAST